MYPDVRDGRPSRDVPIDATDVVARLVGTDLGELESAAQVVRPELPGQHAMDPTADRQVERAEQRDRRRPGSGSLLRAVDRERGRHAVCSVDASWGTGTAGRTRSRIMSAVTSSARAVKLGTIR